MVVRVDLNISLDGFATTTDQTPDDPFGPDWARLVEAYVATRTFRARVLHETSGEGTIGVDDAYAQAYFAEVGAEIMGAGMFGLHAAADDPDWRGWWGDEPPFHVPVFVLTHSPRPVLEMAGGTTFQFLAATPRDTLDLAMEAAGGKDVRIGGRRDRGARVPQGRTRRPAARGHRADPAGPRHPAVGRPPRVRGRLQRDVGGRLERGHAPELLALNARDIREHERSGVGSPAQALELAPETLARPALAAHRHGPLPDLRHDGRAVVHVAGRGDGGPHTRLDRQHDLDAAPAIGDERLDPIARANLRRRLCPRSIHKDVAALAQPGRERAGLHEAHRAQPAIDARVGGGDGICHSPYDGTS